MAGSAFCVVLRSESLIVPSPQDFLLSKVSDCQEQLTPIAQVVGVSFYICGMRPINRIIIHCTATPEVRHHTAAEIDRWHKKRGWSGIGYHYVIQLDGTRETGRPIEIAGAHVKWHNADSIGVVYVGGCDKNMKPKDTRTDAQKAALLCLLRELRTAYPNTTIHGHNEFDKGKACPSFDAGTEYANI